MYLSSSTLILLTTYLISSASASCGHGTTLLRREITHVKRSGGASGLEKRVTVPSFGYFGVQGPMNWHDLNVNNTLCATSTTQSPIDITTTSTTRLAAGAVKLTIPPVDSTEIANLGTTVEVVMANANASVTVGGKTFKLAQFHFHTPSEHTINGEHFPLEMHMVHQSPDGEIAVVAIHFQLSADGSTTDLLTSATRNLGAIIKPGSIAETPALDFAPLVKAISGQALHTYAGSLTTPPCTDTGINFYVTSTQLPLDVATYNKLKKVMGFNARVHQNTPKAENLLSLSAKSVTRLGQPIAPIPDCVGDEC